MIATKELLWLACREKSCCHASKVIITGKDMWRISQALELSPWDFTRYCDAGSDAPDGFQLSPAGEQFQIVLKKRGRVTSQGAPCTFLWKLADGHAQCGLGDLRPRVCAAYPAILVDDILRAESGCCTCRRWSVGDLDEAKDRALLRQVLDDAAEYAGMVEEWNAALSGERSYVDYCLHIGREYSRRHARPT